MPADTAFSFFISYRRKISSGWARAILQALQLRKYDVFIDVDNMRSGINFGEYLFREIARRDVFLLVLDEGTLDKCIQEDDFVRLEIEQAFRYSRTIVPILINGFNIGEQSKHFSGILDDLFKLNGISIYHQQFNAGINRLCEDIALKYTQELSFRSRNLPLPQNYEEMAEQWAKSAIKYYKSGNYEDALLAIDEAIRLNPLLAIAHNTRGVINESLDKVGVAIEDYTTAIRLDHNNSDFYLNRGLAKRETKNFQGVVSDMTSVLRLNPHEYNALLYRGTAHQQLGNNEAALDDYINLLKQEESILSEQSDELRKLISLLRN